MVNKIKSLIPLPVTAIAFAILFVGAPASKANAQVAFQAQVATPVGSFGVAAGPAPYYAGHRYYGHPYYGHGRARRYYGAYGGAYWGPHGSAAVWGPGGWAATSGNVYHQWGATGAVTRTSIDCPA